MSFVCDFKYIPATKIMETNDITIKKPIDVSKELEIINFRVLREASKDTYLQQDFKTWVVNETDPKDDDADDGLRVKEDNAKNDRCKEKTQFRSFQKSMKVLLVFGQCIGLNPVTTIIEKDVSKIRFTVKSWAFIYSVIIAIVQTMKTFLSFKLLFSKPVSIKTLSYVSFHLSISCTSVIFIRIATKWSTLVKEIFNCNLDEYVDKGITRRIKITCIVWLVFSKLEHVLSIFAKLIKVIECGSYDNSIYEQLIRQAFPWVFDFGVPYSIPFGVLLQLSYWIATMNWNYSHLFIVCTSLYLTSVLNEVNKKIIWAADKNYSSRMIWGTLREDYTRATKLVRLFDDLFSGLILVSFASNLFFISLQIFNMLANGLQSKQVIAKACPRFPSGPLLGYEYPLYILYSLTFLVARFLTVALVASSVNVASMVPAPALYRLPSYAYCKEVQRFLDQVHGDFVALSGMDFFYITRDIVLTVTGTIMTYELVLLQFNTDELNKAE